MKNFRNYDEVTINFDTNVNIFIGNNGQGKTNILEALYYFACQKSFRETKNKDLIKWGKEFFEIILDFESQDREHRALTRVHENKSKENYLNGIKKRRAADMVGFFNAVMFAPEHMNLIKGGPKERRQVVDFALCQTDREYFLAIDKYKKILKQKNAYLRGTQGRGEKTMLDIWNSQLAHEAFSIMKKREEFLSELSDQSKERHQDISENKERLEILYRPNIEGILGAEDIQKHFESLSTRESIAGISLSGPHRDDVEFIINGRTARHFASQGQQRSAILSMKLAECEMFKKSRGEYPALLLDDIMSELDKRRQHYVSQNIKDRQIFITCCDFESLGEIKNGRCFRITSGKVEN